MKLKWFIVLVVFTALLMFTACSEAGYESDDALNEETIEESEETVGDDPYPIIVTDDSGTEVTISSEPQTIISILPSVTEIAFSLGLDDRIVAVTDNDNYPEEVKEKESVGGMDLNYEKITSLEPDLILAGNLNGEAVNKLRDLGLTVLVAEGEDLAGTYASIRLVGEVTNRTEEAERVIAEMQADVEEAERLVEQVAEDERVSVWLEGSPDLFTPGAGTMQDELVRLAGAHNVAADEFEGWGQFSEERVVELNPDAIIGFYDNVEETVLNRKAWASLDAVKNNRVYWIDPDLISRPGPRLTEGILQLIKVLYPEIGEAAEKAA